MISSKRGSVGMWVLIAIVLVAIGIGAYYWLSGDSSGIPQPPALPD